MKQYKILIIGLGSIGKRHIRIFKQLIDCKIVVLRQKNKISENFPGVDKFLYSCKDLQREDIDFAVICTPPALHINSAIDLAKNNIPFIIEKPVASSLKRINSLSKLIESKKLPVLVGFNLRHHVLYKKIKDIISSDKLGKILAFFAETGQYLPRWRNYDYRKSCSAHKELGGGVIFDLAHELDFATDLLGDVDRVICFKDKYGRYCRDNFCS